MTRLGSYRIGIGKSMLHTFEKDEAVVLIDNLRASSTIVTALSAGVEEIIPVSDDEKAYRFKKKGVVIAGESGCVKLQGYDIGNSPVELLKTFKKTPFEKLVLKTTNLVPLLLSVPHALICSSLNLSSIAKYINKKKACIMPAGGERGVSEDLGVAFALAACLSEVSFDKNMLNFFTRESPAAGHLCETGYREDVDFISRTDIFDVIPFYDGKSIKNAGKLNG